MWVVCAHPDNDGQAFTDRVPDLAAEIDRIMEIQRMRAEETKHMMHHDLWLDPVGGGKTDLDNSQASFHPHEDDET